MSAHPAPARRSWVSALVAQVTDYVFEPAEVEEAEQEPLVQLKPRPVVAVVAAAPRSGATTVARLLAAELATRAAGAAVVTAGGASRRTAPPSRAAVRLATALAGTGLVQPCGRLCVVRSGTDLAAVVNAARYAAPVVLDVAADGSAARVAALADRVVVVAAGQAEPALLGAVAALIAGEPLKVVNRPREAPELAHADVVIPDSRIGARAALIGTRPLGPLGSAIEALADALEVDP